MQDFERVMLAIYRETVEASKPFTDGKALLAALKPPAASDAMIVLAQRGFLSSQCPVGSLALSETGIGYVEKRLR